MTNNVHPQEPVVSVIIPSLDHPQVGDAVQSVLRSKPQTPFELLVVGLDEQRRVPRDPPVRFVDAGRRVLPGAARNLGASQAAGRILLFTDADCVVDAGWIDNAARVLSGDHPVAGGGIRFPEGSTWDLGDNIAVFHKLHVSCRARTENSYLGSNNLAVAKEAFDRVGGFNGDLWIGEDWDLLNRLRAAGIPVRFDPSFAVVHNSRRDTREKVVEHARSYGEGYAKLMEMGLIAAGPHRVDRLTHNPALAAAWSAVRALWRTAATYAGSPALLRYLRAAHVVFLFHYVRRREIFRALARLSGAAA